MPRVLGKLTSRRVQTAKPKGKRRALFLSDGGNLNLQVTLGDAGNVRRSWVFLYQIDGVKRAMGLGPTHTLSLAEAREKARSLRQKLLDGVDPLQAKEAAKQAKLAEAAKAMTFKQCAEAYMKLHEAGWSTEHRRQWEASLRLHVYPAIGSLSVVDVDTAAVMKLVQPLWTLKTVTAARVLNRIESVINWATASGFRQGDNPASALTAVLPKQSKIAPVEHLTALPWQEIPQFMAELRKLQSTAARCVEFLILTAARTGEAIGATWDEIDLGSRTWTIPASRMKAGKEHRVPLSARALEILGPKGEGYIFGGTKALGETALRRTVLAKLRPGETRWRSSITTHGFRGSFKTWASESTNYAPQIAEAALAHARGGKVEQSYEKGDLLVKRARLMQAWADFCAKGVPAAADVVPLRSARHA